MALINLRQRAQDFLRSSQKRVSDIFGKVEEKSKKYVPGGISAGIQRIKDSPRELFFPTSKLASRGGVFIGKGIQEVGRQIPITTMEAKEQKLPDITGVATLLPPKAVKFGADIIGSGVQDIGFTIEKFSTPKGRLELKQSFKRLPKTLKEEGFLATLDEPAARVAFAGLDIGDVSRLGLIGLFASGGDDVIKTGSRIIEGADTVNDIQKGFEAGRTAKKLKKGKTFFENIRVQFLDRLSPLFDLEKNAAKELPGAISPYKKFRLMAGIGGEATDIVNKDLIDPILRPVAQKGLLDDLSALLILDRSKEIVNRNLKSRYTLEQVESGIEFLRRKTGDNFEFLTQSANAVRKYGDDLLQTLNKSGIIDDATFKTIKAKNQYYVPFQIVDFISNNVEKNKFIKSSFNVAGQDVIKSLKGSTKQLADPLEAMIERTARVTALTRRNEAMKSLVDLRNIDSVFEELIKKGKKIPIGRLEPLKGKKKGTLIFRTAPAPSGFDVINLFEKGKPKVYYVPQEVATALKGLDADTTNMLTRILKPQANLLRVGATGLNIGFIPVNILRDIQDAFFSAFTELKSGGLKATGELLLSYPSAIASALKQDELYSSWVRAGGAQSTFISQILQSTPETISSLKKQGGIVKKVLNSPVDALKFLNRVGEESTRLARFKTGIQRGEDVAEAAFKSRDITVDFAKSGTAIKTLNQVIPFLNAGIQGTEKMFRAFKDNPKAAVIGASMFAGLPATILHGWNNRFQDFQDIPQFEKELNWIMIARDRTPEERENGEPVAGIKIPKPFFVRPIANATEAFLTYAQERNPQALKDFFASTVEQTSPIGIPGTSRFFSQTLPPVFQAGIQNVTNRNLFTGAPIVPRSLENVRPELQFRETTPEIYKKFGQLTGTSPLKVESTVRTTTGGLGGSIADVLSGDIKKGTVGQITRRFANIRSGADVDKLWNEVDEFRTESESARLINKREAEKKFAELKQLPKAQASEAFRQLVKEDKVLAEEVSEISKDEALGLSALDRSIKTLGVTDGTRAKFIVAQFDKLKTKEEKSALFQDLVRKKIITEKVAEQIAFLLKK